MFHRAAWIKLGSLVAFVIVPALSCALGSQDVLPVATRPSAKPIHVWSNLPDWITSLAFLKDGQRLCVGTYEEIVLEDVRKPESQKRLSIKPGYVKSLAISPDGKLIAAGHYQELTLVDPATWSIKRTLGEHAGYVTGIAFSPDTQLLATACDDGVATVWSVANGKKLRTLADGSGKNPLPFQAIAFSPDGKRIATAAGDENRILQPGEVEVFDAGSGKKLLSFTKHRQAATGVAFSPDSKFLASSSYDERVILYDLLQGKATSYFAEHSRPTNAVLIARDGTTVVSASGGRAKDGNEIKIWNRMTGKEQATLGGHSAKVSAIALSPDESLLASGSYDKTVALWDLKKCRNGDTTDRGGDAGLASSLVSKVEQVSAKRSETPTAPKPPDAHPMRVGVVGLDTSHALAFAGVLNDPKAAADVAGFRVVCAYPRGSADIVSSTERIPKYTEDFRKMGIEIAGSIDDLLKKVDVVLLETNDGRPHLEQALAVMKSGKPLFIDKPIAASLADALAIFDAAKKHNVPVFSSSSLRFGQKTQEARHGVIGKILDCQTHSPCTLETTHPDLFWYGIHGVESLFTVMGPGCKSVRRTVSTPTEDVVVGTWADGRVGTFRGTRGKSGGYGGTAKGTKGTLAVGQYEGYRPLVVAIVKFFKTGIPPVTPEETIEIYAFMTAADESKRQHGAEVTLESVRAKARAEAATKIEK